MENFMTWYNHKMEDAQFNRLGVMAFVLLVHTCIVIPTTLLIISHNGINPINLTVIAAFSFAILFAMIAMVPVRYTLPLFVLSTIAHAIVIIVSAI